MMGWAKQAVMFVVCGDESQSRTTITALLPRLYIPWRRREKLSLCVTANKPETTLYRAPTFSLLVSPGGIVHV